MVKIKIIFSIGLLIHYGLKHYDYHDTYCIYEQIEEFNELINEKLPLIVINICNFKLILKCFIKISYFFKENKQKLMELQKDLIGVENLASKSFRVKKKKIDFLSLL